MKLERTFFRENSTKTLRFGGTADHDPDQHLPPKVADVPREVLKSFPHTKRVGNYLLGRTLGEGSFAKVKEGLHILTGERVAVKCIDKKKAKEDVYVRKNMRREGKLLQMIRHRHVIKLYEIMETENSYYLVTELCRGGDLMDYICTKKRLDEKETRRFIKQIVSAMRYLHTGGILHRDLKVENLLLDENKDIKIIDFGLSNAVRVSPTKEGCVTQEFCVTQCGSPAYAAPELLGNKKYGPKIDIWSIGINMYAMLTGNLPFTVEPFNIKALHQKMLTGNMNPLPDTLSKEGRDFLKKLLLPDPDQRTTLNEAMLHPWITDSKNKPMEPAPFPNKLSADNLDNNILKHMSQNLDYRLSDVIRLVTSNIPSNATSTYHMFHNKLNRYNAEMRVQGKVPADEAQLISSSRSTQNTSGYISRDDVIDLVPMSNGVGVRDVTNNKKLVEISSKSGTNVDEMQAHNKKVTSSRHVPTGSPVRLLHRETQNGRSLQTHEKPHHSAMANLHSSSDHEGHVSPETTNAKHRPATTHEKTCKNDDVFSIPTGNDGTPAWGGSATKTASTKETRMSSSDTGTERYKYSHVPPDLPAIAEKPSSSEEGNPRIPFKTKGPASPGRRLPRDVKHSGNYSFRPRGAFTSNKITDLSVHSQNAQTRVLAYSTSGRHDGHVVTSPQPTSSGHDHKITGSGHVGQIKEVTSELGGSVSEPVTKKDRTIGRFGVGPGRNGVGDVKVSPRRVLIDVEHYERFTRKNAGAFHTSISTNTSVLQPPEKRTVAKSDIHTRRLVSLVYPTYNKIIKQGARNIHVYPRNHRLPNDRLLNVTGERTGVNGSRIVNAVKAADAETKYQTTSKLPQSLDGTVGKHVENGDSFNLRQCSNNKDSRSPTTDDNGVVTLPVISPVLTTKTLH